MLGVELTAARLRRAVHLGSAVVADSGWREAAGSRAGARAWAERRHGLHVVPDERPIGARRKIEDTSHFLSRVTDGPKDAEPTVGSAKVASGGARNAGASTLTPKTRVYAVFSSPEPGIYYGTWNAPDEIKTHVHGPSPIKYLNSPPTTRAVGSMAAAVELFREHGVPRPIFRGPQALEGYSIGAPVPKGDASIPLGIPVESTVQKPPAHAAALESTAHEMEQEVARAYDAQRRILLAQRALEDVRRENASIAAESAERQKSAEKPVPCSTECTDAEQIYTWATTRRGNIATSMQPRVRLAWSTRDW